MRHLRPIIVAGSMVLGTLGIRAEEAAKPTLEQPPQDSIATARQSFESLSKKHSSEEGGALQIPTLAAPEFNHGAPTTSAESSRAKPIAKPSKNWLVDGVMSKPTGTERVSPSADTRRTGVTDANEADVVDDPESVSLVAGSDVSSAQPRAAALKRESAAPVSESINPLASYMSGWISTQDRALLLPQKSQDAGAATWNNSLANLTSASSGATAAGSTLENAGLNQPAFKSIARENPYLDVGGFTVNRSPDSGPVMNSQDFSPAAPRMLDPVARAPIFEASPPAAADRSQARDLAKPDDNAKYFKQLKRF